MALSNETKKWIIGTLLVLIGLAVAVVAVVIQTASSALELGRTLATESDLVGLATTANVSEVSDRLGATVADVREASTRLETTVGDLGATVSLLDATVSDLGSAVADVRATVDGFQGTTDSVNTLVTVTLPALLNCMIELDIARGANRPDARSNADWSFDLNRDLPYICLRLRDDFDAFSGALDSLVPQPPD